MSRLVAMPPLVTISIDDRIRFWSSFTKNGPDECWPWKKSIGRFRPEDVIGTGYGIFKLKRQVYKAHRVAYFFEHGVDPGKLLVRHTCDFTPCTNPKHLVLGTQFDNMQDAYDRKRKFNYGDTAPGSRLKEYQVKEIKILIDQGILSLAEIGRRYDADRTTIWKIKEKLIWWCV